MKSLVKLPIYLALITFLFMLMMSSAQAISSEQLMDETITGRIKEQIRKHKSKSLAVKVQTSHEDRLVRPIDGAAPAIQISQEKTSLPDEFEERVKNLKTMERYYGK